MGAFNKILVISGVIILSIIHGFWAPDNCPKIYMAGDSTMENKRPGQFPETGWGQVFGSYFTNDVKIINYATGGASTKSFISQGRWKKITDSLVEGDYVFIEFGHNDEKPPRGTTLKEYEANLTKLVKEVKQKKGIPVLLTPIMRRSIKAGKFYNSHGSYPATMRKVAQKEGVVIIDMLEKSNALLQNTGIEASKKLYLHLKPGQYHNYPKGRADNTHLSQEGANEMAKLAVEGIKELNLPLAGYLK